MAGLVQQAMAQPQAQPPAGAPAGPGAAAPGATGGQPDPQAVERVKIAAAKIIHNPQTTDQLIAMMKQAGDPVEALVQTTLLIMRQLFEKSGGKIPPDVLGAVGVAVMQEMARIAATAKLFQATPEMFKAAVNKALSQVMQGAQGGQPAGQPAPGQPPAAAPAAPDAATASPEMGQ